MSDRWSYKLEGATLKAEPNPEPMLDWINEAREKLMYAIMVSEEQLVLGSMPTSGIVRLIELCEREMKRRLAHEASDGEKNG